MSSLVHADARSRALLDADIVVVDDDTRLCRLLERILGNAGFTRIRTFTDPERALAAIDIHELDALLLDLVMPDLTGFEVMARLASRLGPDEFLPILVLTGELDADLRKRALDSGAKDFVFKPFDATEVVARLRNLVQTNRLHRRLRSFNALLSLKVEERTADLLQAKLEILHRLVRAAEYRDDITGRHAIRVGHLSGLLARGLGLDGERARTIARGAPLHDIGKIGIPDAILHKPGPLTSEEERVMASHTRIGAEILGGSDFELLEVAESIALSHHERWDGSGYPRGLAAEEIPVEGRIVAVADAFDCMTHDRPYRMGRRAITAIEEIERCAGTHFDPDVSAVLVGLTDALRDDPALRTLPHQAGLLERGLSPHPLDPTLNAGD